MKSNRHLVKFSSLLVLLLLLAACGSSEPTPPTSPIVQPPTVPPPTDQPGATTISGTVTAPAGGDIVNTEVGACPVINNAQDCTNAVSVVISQSGPSAVYNLSVQAGQPYAIVAAKDVNNTGALEDGDYIGGYPAFDSLTPVTAPASSIDITMQIRGGGTTPPPGGGTPPPVVPPGGGSDISGTVTAAAGGDVANTFVLACPVVSGSPDCDNAIDTTISQPGPSAAYSLSVPAGEYVVGAVQDVNNDLTPDFIGVYPQPVSPPASSINIQLEPAPVTNSSDVPNVSAFSTNLFNLGELQKLLE